MIQYNSPSATNSYIIEEFKITDFSSNIYYFPKSQTYAAQGLTINLWFWFVSYKSASVDLTKYINAIGMGMENVGGISYNNTTTITKGTWQNIGISSPGNNYYTYLFPVTAQNALFLYWDDATSVYDVGDYINGYVVYSTYNFTY